MSRQILRFLATTIATATAVVIGDRPIGDRPLSLTRVGLTLLGHRRSLVRLCATAVVAFSCLGTVRRLKKAAKLQSNLSKADKSDKSDLKSDKSDLKSDKSLSKSSKKGGGGGNEATWEFEGTWEFAFFGNRHGPQNLAASNFALNEFCVNDNNSGDNEAITDNLKSTFHTEFFFAYYDCGGEQQAYFAPPQVGVSFKPSKSTAAGQAFGIEFKVPANLDGNRPNFCDNADCGVDFVWRVFDAVTAALIESGGPNCVFMQNPAIQNVHLYKNFC